MMSVLLGFYDNKIILLKLFKGKNRSFRAKFNFRIRVLISSWMTLQVFLSYQLPTHFWEASFQNNETRHDQSFQTGKLRNWK